MFHFLLNLRIELDRHRIILRDVYSIEFRVRNIMLLNLIPINLGNSFSIFSSKDKESWK